MSTYEFDTGGVERLVGQLKAVGGATNDVPTQQASGLLLQAPGGGGGSAVQAVYSGTSVSVLNGAADNLTWDTLASGTELLDRTDPANPTFLAAGTYAISVVFTGDALTAAGYAIGQVSAPVTFGAGYTPVPAATWGASGTVIVAEGDTLNASLVNQDGASARNFNIDVAVVVKSP